MVASRAERTRRAKREETEASVAEVGRAAQPRTFAHTAVLEEARAAGLLKGEKSEHVSFRAPPALIEAAKRETGVTSTSELGILALALLAQPDPVVSAMRRARGRLGADHQLEF